MRKRFEQQLSIGTIPISEVKFNLKSRDSIAPFLAALQKIYLTPEYNQKILCILEDKLVKGKSKTGRPGMDLWQIFVLAQFRLRLGDFLKELDLTEGKATGIPRIKKALKENGSPEPFFDFDEDRTFFEVDFYIHPAFKEEQIKVIAVNNESLYIGERASQILDIIKSNSSVTASEIAEKIGISKRATEKHLSKLKSAGILDRIGSDKSGQWVINSSV